MTVVRDIDNPPVVYRSKPDPRADTVKKDLSYVGPDGNIHYPLPTHAEARKEVPIYSGVLRYFPLAIAEVAKCSFRGNEQHNPNTPLHWDRAKSGDELDALARHLMEAGTKDKDGVRHSTKVAWRALANLQKELEDART